MKKISVLFFSILLYSFTCYAAILSKNQTSIPLLDQPQANSKVVGQITAGHTIIPIFSQGDWVKVGDSNTGNVGWVANKTLEEHGFPKIYIKSVGSTKNGANDSQVQIIQYSGTQKMDEKQIQAMMKHFQEQQARMQKMFNQMLEQNQIFFDEISKQLQMQLKSMASSNH